MKVSFDYYKAGNCWKFRFSTLKAWSGKLFYINFWRFQVCFDRRKNWINDMINGKGE